MSFIQYLTEMFLTEATALTKGSQRVLADKKLVAGLADAMRDDARSHPQNFPPNSARTFQKAPDEELAQWFLENIDKIEKEGYEDTIYSKDGVYNPLTIDTIFRMKVMKIPFILKMVSIVSGLFVVILQVVIAGKISSVL